MLKILIVGAIAVIVIAWTCHTYLKLKRLEDLEDNREEEEAPESRKKKK
jgi:hypothetical protein